MDPLIAVTLDRSPRVYAGGDTMRIEYQFDAVPKEDIAAVEISVLWLTEGKGEPDMGVHYFRRMTPDDVELARFRELMDDDLNTPAVVAQLFGLVTQANTALDAGDPAAAGRAWATVLEVCTAVGIQLTAGAEVPAEVENLARLRDEARGAKDWAEADRLRDEIRAAGWEVEDTPEGTRVHPS